LDLGPISNAPPGRPKWGFGVALATIVVWGVTGPIFGFSDTWQLVINLEDLTEAEIRLLHSHYQRLVTMAKRDLSLTVSHSVEEADERHRAKTRHRGPAVDANPGEGATSPAARRLA
jgi:hypothetical protein